MKPTHALRTGLLLLLPGVVSIPAIGVAVSQRNPHEVPLDQQLLTVPPNIEAPGPTEVPSASGASVASAVLAFAPLPGSTEADSPLVASLGSSDSRSSPPPPSAPPPVQSKGVVRLGDTLLQIAQRYGITMQELLRFNPGLDTARLVAGTEIQLVQSAPVRQRAVLGLRPSTSGGLSWPDQPNLGHPQQPFHDQGAHTWIWPASGVFTSGYGWRWGRMHRGIDVANNVGTPIKAARNGRVVFSGWNSGGFGYLVTLQHPDGSRSLYAHNSRLMVSVGQEVRQGTVIALMGSTGNSTGPHLHFEIHPAGSSAANPLTFLPPRA
ncbi:MAG: M23 family metallopeptidase [Cyanobium sp. PLM2.Bin73]|nr:MAG: M23 family metallopeptidase [Cyanobium sp. PLM2.Bin73]